MPGAPGVRRSTDCSDFRRREDLDGVDAMLPADVDWYLPTDLLVKVDIATMANSLEARSPFLDAPDGVRRAAAEPFQGERQDLEVHLEEGGRRPRPGREHAPAEAGFRGAGRAWFRGELKEFLADHLLSPRFAQRGCSSPRVVQRLFDDHQRGAGDYAHHLWTLLMLELWFRWYIDRAPAINRTIAVTA